MTYEPPEPPSPPDDEHLSPTLADLDAEQDLIGSLLYDEEAFERADLPASEFYYQRFRWIWEAAEAIRRDSDHIDIPTLERYLEKSGRLQAVTAQHSLDSYYNPTLLHVEANAHRIHDMARRRHMIQDANAQANRANDLSTPLPAEPGSFKTSWSGPELEAADFPDPVGPVPGLIPNGLTVLGGRPKRGKSWLMLQAGCSLVLGGRFLDHELKPCKVLFYALEDHPRRLKSRIEKYRLNPAPPIDFELTIQPLEYGGVEQIEKAIHAGGYQVVILDTLRRAMPGRDFNKDGALYDEVLGKLQQIAQQNHVSIVVILHTRKNASGFDPDPVDDVLGSTGLTASADCVLALYTEQGKKGSTLKGRGRDLDDIDLALQFDPESYTWQSLGESGEVKNTQMESDIVSVLEELKKATIATISRSINKDFSNTRRRLISMWTGGKVRREEIDGKIYYFLSSNVQEVKEVVTNVTNDQ